MIQLFERYDRLQTGRRTSAYNTGTFLFDRPGLAMSQGMSVLADRKDYAGVLRLVDFNLAFARRKQEHQSPVPPGRALRPVTPPPGTRARPRVLHDLGRAALPSRPDHFSTGQRIL